MAKNRFKRKSIGPSAAAAEPLEQRLLLAAQMVADLITGTPGSSPSSMVDVNGTMFFIADDGAHVRELWKSDGTPDGTTLVKDIKPGTGSGLAGSWLINFNGRAFFMADDGVNGAELWRSDGTPEGTILVKDIMSGATGSNPGKRLGDDDKTRLVVGNTLYFAANDGTGNELWKTDGTRRGTVLVKQINAKAGSSSSDPHQMTALNGQLVFVANNGTQTRLFRSDGTDAGTYDLGAPLLNPNGLTASGPYVYFTSIDRQSWNTLARTDGTVAGTATVGTVSGAVGNLVDLNGRPAFTVTDLSFQTSDLYAMDPATSALARVAPLGSGANIPEYLTALNGAVYFAMHDNGLWKTDGTAAGTLQFSTAQPDSTNGWSRQFVRYGTNGFVFYGADGAGGRALWKSDGTTQGTTLVKTLDLPAPDYTNPAPLLAIAQSIYVVSNLPDSGAELWRSDGTAPGTVPLKDVNQLGIGSSPVPGAELNGRLYFAGAGGQLWVTDGSTAGTQPVTGGAAGSPADFMNVDGVLYFTGFLGFSDRSLYRTDGTPGGSYALRPAGGNGPAAPREITNVNGTLFFSAYDPTNGFELWKTNGTAAGTVLLKDAYPGFSAADPKELTALGGKLIYTAATGTEGRELWVSDGTAAGTVLLKDLFPGSATSNPRELTRLGDAVYFFADGPEGTTSLWRTDGTAAGTVQVLSLTGNLPSSLVAANGLLFFLRSDPDTGRELWATDGTPQGTRLVRDIVPGPGSSKIAGLLAAGDTLFFQANDVDHGAELWRSDGTAAGTTMVADAFPGLDSSNPLPAFDANGLLVFTATDASHGTELWRSDGTAAGTSLVADINPGPDSSAPGKFAVAGGVLYFSATDGTHGAELWKLPDIPQPLHAEAGGPYLTTEGQSATLSSFGSTGAIADYEWDFDYDPAAGFQVDATGATATFAGLDGPSVHAVALRVRTATGATAIDVAQVQVGNVAPAVSASAPATVTAGAPYVLQLSYADPGQDAPTSWKVEWGDGAVETFQGNPSSVSHVYATPGARAVYAWATDDDGTYAIKVPGVTVGGPDTSFSQDGMLDLHLPDGGAPSVSDMLVLPDGRILALTSAWSLFRFNPDGTPDTTFGGGDGVVQAGVDAPAHLNALSSAFALQPDGKIVVVGTFYNPTYVYYAPVVARFNADGTADPTLSFPAPTDPNQPFPQSFASDVAIQPDGRLLIAGTTYNDIGGGTRRYMAVMRLNADGSADTSFATGGRALIDFSSVDNFGLAIKPLADGRILIGGNGGYDADSRIAIARLTPTGALDPTFGTGGLVTKTISSTTQPFGYTFQDDGKILAVGRTLVWTWPYKASLALVRFNADGSLDTSFDADGVIVVRPGTDAVGTSVVVDAGGRITVAGRADNQLAVFRYLPDGRPDTDFGQGGVVISSLMADDGYPARLVQQPDGRLLASTWSGATAWITRLTASPLTVQVSAPAPAPAPAGTAVSGSSDPTGSGSTTNGSTKQTTPKPAPKPAPKAATKPQPKPPVARPLAPAPGRAIARLAQVPTFSIRKVVKARRGVSDLFA